MPPPNRDSDSDTAWITRLGPGRVAFNRGDFFQAHELWEEIWHTLAGAERALVHGLIQIAAGLHHLQRSRPRPAARLLTKGIAKLARGAPALTLALEAGLPIDALARDATRVLAQLEASGEQGDGTAADIDAAKKVVKL